MSDTDPTRRTAGVVLAGGTAARLDGADKASVEVGGRTLLEHAVDALAEVDEVVVVMPESRPTSRPVTVVQEDPPQGGPAAGILTGIEALSVPADDVVILPVDMPWVTAGTVRRLLAAAEGHDGAFLNGPDGFRQLAGVIDAQLLTSVAPVPGDRHGLPVHHLLHALDLVVVDPQGREGNDIDTWEDLREGREAHED